MKRMIGRIVAPFRRPVNLFASFAAMVFLAACMDSGTTSLGTSATVANHPAKGLDAADEARVRSLAADEWGVPAESVVVGDGFVAVGDMAIPISSYLSSARDSALSKGSQRRRLLNQTCWGCSDQRLVDADRISDVRVYVATPGLIPYVDAAIRMWNNSGSNIFLRRVSASPYDTKVSEVTTTSCGAQYVGCGEYATGGSPGSYVQIVKQWTSWTGPRISAVVAHELGHNMAFAHTNEVTSNDRHIQGTPDNADDLSLMLTWTGPLLTYWDKIASRILYPQNRLQDFTRLGDVDGDGDKDLIMIADNGINVSLRNPDGTFGEPTLWQHEFSKEQGWSRTVYPIVFGDFNGDGKMDIAGFGMWGTTVAISTGTSYTSSLWLNNFGSNQGYGPVNNFRLVGDFNGDGKDDILATKDQNAYVALSNGSGFSAPMFWGQGMGIDQGPPFNNITKLVGDFNGDGKSDLVVFSQTAGTRVYISNGSKFTESLWLNDMTEPFGWRANDHLRLVGDFNGDGKDDIVGFHNYETFVGISTGSSFRKSSWITDFSISQGWSIAGTPRMVGDFNGDGRDDIAGFAYAGVIVRLSTGSNFLGEGGGYWVPDFGVNQGWNSVQLPRMVGDMNNDGKSDLVCLGWNEFIISNSSGASFVPYLGLQYRTY